MKNILFLIGFVLITISAKGQKQYTILGENYDLKTEITGTIELLWNVIDGKYRYFAKKGEAIVELTNTKGSDNKFQEEYKTILRGITSEQNQNTKDVKLTLPSLRDYIYSYNKATDINYVESNKEPSVQARLLIFGGLTNSPFVNNLENSSNPVFGLEVEVFEANNLPRHSIYLQLKQTTTSKEFKYSNTQIGIGYRFRFVSTETFNIYGNIMTATYSFSKNETVIADQVIEITDNSFHAPFYFGVGGDIKVSDNGFITIAYDEIFAISSENQGNFSTHITVGYKFNL